MHNFRIILSGLLFFIILRLGAQDLNDPKIIIQLKNFDVKAAVKEMTKKKIQEKDQAGYLNYLKRKYLKEHFQIEKRELPLSKNHKLLNAACQNAGFEDMDFSNWQGGTGYYPGSLWNPGIITAGPNADIFDYSARHTIITIPPGNNNPALGPVQGYDPLAINPLTGLAEIPFIPPNGSGVSCRLGNGNVGAETEHITYTMDVTNNNTNFYYRFAIVLQDPNHPIQDQPFFMITAKDSSGNPVGGPCGTYNVNSTQAQSDTSFVKSTYNGDLLYYRKWRLVGIDLKAYVGQRITIDFQSADCSQGGHFGYAYIEAGCGMLRSVVNLCQGDTAGILVAPSGFTAYEWFGPNDINDTIPNSNNDSISINLMKGDTFYVHLISEMGCRSTLQTIIDKYSTVNILSASSSNSCKGGSSGDAAIIPAGSPSGYNFLWTPGGYTSSSVAGLSAGNYSVHVSSPNAMCSSVDTIITVNEDPNNVVLDQTSTICMNDSFAFTSNFSGMHSLYDPTGQLLFSGPVLNYKVYNPIPGIYTDTTVTSEGCSEITNISLSYNAITASINVVNNYCYDGYSGSLTGTLLSGPSGSPYTYTWTSDSGYVYNSASLNNLHAGTYQLLIQSGNCSFRDTAVITEGAPLPDTLEILANFCKFDTSAILRGPISSSFYNYQWFENGVQVGSGNSDTLIIFNPQTTYGNFSVSYSTTPYGCRRKTSVVKSGDISTVFIPGKYINVFTPNNDAKNDLYFPFFSENFRPYLIRFYAESFNLTVFNRWGVKVFVSDNYMNAWDGKHKGKDVDEGVYYWEVSYKGKCDDHEVKKEHGFVHLLR